MSESSIPKNIFLSLGNKEILKNMNNKYTQIINNIRENFSDFEIFIYDDCY